MLQKYVQMSALDDKEVPSAEEWQSAVRFMSSSLKRQIKLAEDKLQELQGPMSTYDRWVRWKSQSESEVKRMVIAEELSKFLAAEPVSNDSRIVVLIVLNACCIVLDKYIPCKVHTCVCSTIIPHAHTCRLILTRYSLMRF